MHERELFSSSGPFGRGTVRGTAGSKELLIVSSASTTGLTGDATGSIFT